MNSHTVVASLNVDNLQRRQDPTVPPPRPVPPDPVGFGIEYTSGHSNIYKRRNLLPHRGDVVHGHEHNFDHDMVVWRGAVRVSVLDNSGRAVLTREITAPGPEYPDAYPDWLLIKAGVRHEILALTDNVEFWCLYAHRDPQGRVSLEYTGWEPAYC
jgi:hypothetical protein